MISFLYINFAFAANDNVDNIIDYLYSDKCGKIAEDIFVDKKILHDMLYKIDTIYDIDLLNDKSLTELNGNIQKKMLKGSGYSTQQENTLNKIGDIGIMSIFKNKTNILVNNKTDMPLIVGDTYQNMDFIINAVINSSKGKKKDNYIILSSDRIFSPEDFSSEQDQWSYNILVAKNKQFNNFRIDIFSIVSDYFKDSINAPLIKKMILYSKLLSLVNPRNGSISSSLLNDIQQKINISGIDSDDVKAAISDYREFLYTEGIKDLPNEYDLANMLISKYQISNSNIIFVKTNYQIQDYPTTDDKYRELLRYVNQSKINVDNFFLVGTDAQVYDQWLQFIMIYNKKIKFGNVLIADNIVDTILLSDQVAKLFGKLNKFCVL